MPTSPAKLLLADQDPQFRGVLHGCLEREGFEVWEVADGSGLLSALRRDLPHLILLDLQIPPFDALDLCRRIKQYADVPVVVLTALRDEEVKLEALNLYAEDYMVKPVPLAEVVARVRRILRRTWLVCLPTGAPVEVDDRLSLDFVRREARTPFGVVRLTPLETRLLQILVRNAGQVLPSQLLLERLWGDEEGFSGSLWEYVRRVRRKIGDDASKPRYILNEPGLGYRFTGVIPSTN